MKENPRTMGSKVAVLYNFYYLSMTEKIIDRWVHCSIKHFAALFIQDR
jgi:hypothetical protein